MDFWMKYYGQLEGETIAKVEIVDEDGEFWPVLHTKSGLKLEISQDEEGNRPGFIFGLPVPQG